MHGHATQPPVVIQLDPAIKALLAARWHTLSAAHEDYSVRLAGMTIWDEHLRSIFVARQSADELRTLGIGEDVHIVDDVTGEVVE